jgi:lipoate-protein ligase A
MRYLDLDLVLAEPAEQLAADEALLDGCEAGEGGETLAFWEPRRVFVVLGYANKVATEVNAAACAASAVPIFRRCTGGGTVVQMPGGLNFSLVLRIDEHGPTRNITAANGFIMEKNRAAVQAALEAEGRHVAVRGHTDLAVAEAGDPAPVWRKVGGNAQRRRRRFLLFHGTLLLNCDLGLISELLPMPSLEPDYRGNRPHAQFVTNLDLPAAAVKTALRRMWGAEGGPAEPPLKEIEKLAREKYATPAWNHKF